MAASKLSRKSNAIHVAPVDDLKNGIDELAKASQSFAEKLYAEAQNDAPDSPDDGSEDVVEGEVIEDE